MRRPVWVIICCILLFASVVLAESDCEPRYHWPEYAPFSPGSWAWPTAGGWELPPSCQNYGVGPATTEPPPPQVIVVYPPLAAPPVQANQNIIGNCPSLSPPAVSVPNTPAATSPQWGSPLYLIAQKDGVIRAAQSYRVDGGLVYYVDLDGARKVVPLDRVDRGLTGELNRQRQVEFHLPPE